MPNRRTLIGLLVVALVAGGVFVARSRSHHAGATHADGAPHHPADRASLDEALPDVTNGDATAVDGDARITLSVSPHPPVAFAKNQFRVRAESGGAPVALDDGRVSFEMVMPMGEHRYSLVASQDGWHYADVVLPMCKSGNPRWYAIVEGRANGRPITARFRLDLTAPPS